VRAPRVIATASLPGRPGRVLAAPAVRSSQAQVHVTNFDYNQHPLNTMPDTRPTSRARVAALGAGSAQPSARTASGHPRDGAAARAARQTAKKVRVYPSPPRGASVTTCACRLSWAAGRAACGPVPRRAPAPQRAGASAAGGADRATGRGPIAVTGDLASRPDLGDLQCRPEARPPSVPRNSSPAPSRRLHAAPAGPADTSATERPVMRGHDRRQPALRSGQRPGRTPRP
jgi:hypothetical protein